MAKSPPSISQPFATRNNRLLQKHKTDKWKVTFVAAAYDDAKFADRTLQIRTDSTRSVANMFQRTCRRAAETGHDTNGLTISGLSSAFKVKKRAELAEKMTTIAPKVQNSLLLLGGACDIVRTITTLWRGHGKACFCR